MNWMPEGLHICPVFTWSPAVSDVFAIADFANDDFRVDAFGLLDGLP